MSNETLWLIGMIIISLLFIGIGIIATIGQNDYIGNILKPPVPYKESKHRNKK